MPRRAASISQADIARAIRAARQAGADAVEIRPGGTIFVLISAPPVAPDLDDAENALAPGEDIVL